MKGITLTDGTPLNLDEINPIVGYQAEHKLSGRLLPMCNRFEVYGLFAMVKKMGDVAQHLDECGIPFNIWDYDLISIREDEGGSKFIRINIHMM